MQSHYPRRLLHLLRHLHLPASHGSAVLLSGSRVRPDRQRRVPGYGQLLRHPHGESHHTRLERRFLLLTRGGHARRRRASHSRIPQQSCGYHHHPDVPRLADELQTPLLGHDTLLRADVFRHRLYPGTLRHRRDCRMDFGDSHLCRFTFFIEKICLIQNYFVSLHTD